MESNDTDQGERIRSRSIKAGQVLQQSYSYIGGRGKCPPQRCQAPNPILVQC